jgi:hypothetical protein
VNERIIVHFILAAFRSGNNVVDLQRPSVKEKVDHLITNEALS